MQNLTENKDLLGLNLSLTVSPQITVGQGNTALTPPAEEGGFLIQAEAALHYASFSRILNELLTGKKITLSEGLFAHHVVIKNLEVRGGASDALLLEVQFGGSFKGTVFFSAVPVYDSLTASVVLQALRYDLHTANLLLKGAKLLFASRIEKELQKLARVPAAPLLNQVKNEISAALNRVWGKGIRASGEVTALQVQHVQAGEAQLFLKATCRGNLQLAISEAVLDFQR